MSLLPEDMMVEILVRIPARFLVGLRCVCKSWDALIINPQFALKHCNNNNAQQILLHGLCEQYLRKFLSLFRLNHHPQTLFDINLTAGRKFDYIKNLNFPDCFKELVVAGSFNGIICLSSFCKSPSRFVALWNPVINYWKPIPLLRRKNDNDMYTSVGLAFDSLTSDYKIIRLVSAITDKKSPPSSRIQIYSANLNSWLDVNQGSSSSVIPFFTTQPNCSVIVKGVPYWSRSYNDEYCYNYNDCQTNVIAAIDPHTGLYKEIPYPQIVTNENNTTVHPFNFMNSLAVLIYSPGENLNPQKMFHVYALDESSAATWIQLYTSAPTILQNTNMCILRCFQDAGTIIVVGWNYDRGRSFLYDLHTDCLCHSIGMDAIRPRWDETYHHVETLVCLNGMEPIQKEDNNNKERGGPMYLGRQLGPLL